MNILHYIYIYISRNNVCDVIQNEYVVRVSSLNTLFVNHCHHPLIRIYVYVYSLGVAACRARTCYHGGRHFSVNISMDFYIFILILILKIAD